MPTLVEEYVTTGKIVLEYRDLTFGNEESTRAAEAAACALEQGQFWPYHEQLFAHQRPSNEESFSREQVEEIAQEAGLNLEQFDTCLDSDAIREEIAAMQEEAQALGLDSTPTFVVNGRIVSYRGYDQLRSVIEDELAQATATTHRSIGVAGEDT